MTFDWRAGLLVVLWLLAWGELTLANVVSGIAVATVLLIAFPLRRRDPHHRRTSIRGLVVLTGFVVEQLVVSNVVMALLILARRVPTEPGVLAHRLRTPSEEVVTIMSTVIALSPGTMVVDVSADSSVLYVHFFRLVDVDASRAFLDRLERLVIAAIPARDGGGPTGSSDDPTTSTTDPEVTR